MILLELYTMWISLGITLGIKSLGAGESKELMSMDFPVLKETRVLGRVYTISPRQGECFYL